MKCALFYMRLCFIILSGSRIIEMLKSAAQKISQTVCSTQTKFIPNASSYWHKYYINIIFMHKFFFGDQELIPYRYSSCCSFCSNCWGNALRKKPKAPSFQIGSGWNLTGLFFQLIRLDWRSHIVDMTSYFQDGGHCVRPPLAAAWAASVGYPLSRGACVTSLADSMRMLFTI